MDMVKCDREIAEEVLEESGGDPNAAALKLLTSGVARSQPRKRSRNSWNFNQQFLYYTETFLSSKLYSKTSQSE